jgi:hypothetical protein
VLVALGGRCRHRRQSLGRDQFVTAPGGTTITSAPPETVKRALSCSGEVASVEPLAGSRAGGQPDRRAPHVSAQHLHQLRPVRIPRTAWLTSPSRRSRDHNLPTDRCDGPRPAAGCVDLGQRTDGRRSIDADAAPVCQFPRHRNCNVNLDELDWFRPDLMRTQQARGIPRNLKLDETSTQP